MLAGWCEDVLSSCSSPLFSSVSLETNFVEQVVRRGCSSHLCHRHGHHCCCCSSSSAAATICSSSPCSRAFPPPSCSLRSSHHPPMCAGTSPCCLPLPTYSRASEGIQEALAAARPPLLVEDNLLHLSIILRVLRACHGCHAHYSQGACIQELWTPTTLHGVAMLRPHLASHMYTRSLGAT